MIIQEFYFDNDKFLTIVHENMDDNLKNRNINDSVDIVEHIISFNEYYADEFNLDNINHDCSIEGFS